MCEYNGDYEGISHKRGVKTRRAHDCGGCLADWPAGTVMGRNFGKSNGELCTTYVCPVCTFAADQDDHSPLHICWGDMWDPSAPDENPQPTYDYIKECLAAGTTPTVAGVKSFREALLIAEDA